MAAVGRYAIDSLERDQDTGAMFFGWAPFFEGFGSGTGVK